MPIRKFKCSKCEKIKRTFKKEPQCCGEKMKVLMKAPATKMMEPIDIKRGRSDIKNQDDVLLKRAKEYARDTEMDDLIQNNSLEQAAHAGWLNKSFKGKRKKIDDKWKEKWVKTYNSILNVVFVIMNFQ